MTLRPLVFAATAALALLAPALCPAETPARTLAQTSAAGPMLAAPAPFSLEALAARAAAIARAPYVPAPPRQPEVLERIDYDAHWQIRYRKDKTLQLGAVPVQFFHLGTYFRQPVKMFAVANGQARELVYAPDLFDMPKDSPARDLTADAGFAGFRILRPDLSGDWISFLGATYFRTEGALGQFGLSARAIAVDTGLPSGEEFPRFTEVYLEEGAGGQAVVTALVEGRSLAGVWRMAITNTPGQGQVMAVESRIYLRKPVARLGLAPLTSMFWYSETNRWHALDWRPEVHDSDGLLIAPATGTPVWRALDTPGDIVTTRFAGPAPKGFGLVQRDRDFEHYQDDGVWYDRRPTVWVEPVSDWGRGAVTLVELPTHDEIYDNIVAFWTPETLPAPGQELRFDYRLHWVDRVQPQGDLAQVVASRIGMGGNAGVKRPRDQIKVVLDFEGPALAGLGEADGVTPEITAPQGVEIINPFAHPIRGSTRWRLVFDVKSPPGTGTVDLLAGLSRGGRALSETWAAPLHPDRIEKLR
ncbi:glucan biosynthesis protein [Rhodobacter capsulatus]|uniref:glucan biosynthesis protein n=1 Tax=Rhodobacter capsulatus TaxID=1061 RepID=UPI0003D2BD36|nr:glucan biosynthesis protein D [Rhodobacter capsulatus]ETD79953.1 glucan biosynthesis protein D [Rhodobacter capsulatus B6]